MVLVHFYWTCFFLHHFCIHKVCVCKKYILWWFSYWWRCSIASNCQLVWWSRLSLFYQGCKFNLWSSNLCVASWVLRDRNFILDELCLGFLRRTYYLWKLGWPPVLRRADCLAGSAVVPHLARDTKIFENVRHNTEVSCGGLPAEYHVLRGNGEVPALCLVNRTLT